jgi:phage gp36-like protein
MGDYVTDITALEAKYGEARVLQLIDLDADGDPDTATVDQAIADAESIINAKLARRYDIASLKAAAPPVVIGIALDLSFCELAKSRDESLLAPQTGFAAIRSAAMKLLDEIASGKIDLDVSTVTEEASYTIESAARVFTRETMKDF